LLNFLHDVKLASLAPALTLDAEAKRILPCFYEG